MREKRKTSQKMPKKGFLSNLESKSLSYLFFLFFLSGIIVYSPSLGGKFLLDDNQYIVYNPSLQNINSLKQYLKSTHYRRPLYWFSFFVEKKLWDKNPSGYKLINLLFHILTAFIFFLFLKCLLTEGFDLKESDAFYLSFFSGLLFLVFPLATEAVSYVSGRSNGIGGFFFILSSYLFRKWIKGEDVREKYLSLGLAFFSGILSIMFKEIYIVFPFFWFFIFVLNERLTPKRIVRFSVVFVVLLLGLSFAVFFVKLQPFPLIKKTIKRYSRNINQEALATNIYAVAYSLRLAVYPDNLNIDHDLPVIKRLSDLRVLGSLMFLFLLFVVFWFFRKKFLLSFFALLSYLLTLSPTNSLILRRGDWLVDPLSERNLYIPSLFAVIIIVEIIKVLSNGNLKRFKIFALIVFCLFATRSFDRNLDYRNSLTFWKSSLKYSENRARPNFNYAVALKDTGKFQEAVSYAEKAFKLKPASNTLGLLSSLYKVLGQEGNLENLLSTALENKNLRTAFLYHELGEFYVKKGDYLKAKSYLSLSLKKKECYILPRLTLTYIYLADNEFEKAKNHLEVLNSIVNEYSNRYYCNVLIDNVVKARVLFADGLYYFAVGKEKDGIKYCLKAIKLYPEFTEPYLKLGEHYYLKGHYEQALNFFEESKNTDSFQKYKDKITEMKQRAEEALKGGNK